MKPGETAYLIELDGTENAEFKQILEGWIDALEMHEYASHDYKNRELFGLGIRGEFVGFWRKAQKLHAEVWEQKLKLTREGVQEVLMDCMGAVGLMLSEQRKNKDGYSASWRDNHNNKPTFGPGPDDRLATFKPARQGATSGTFTNRTASGRRPEEHAIDCRCQKCNDITWATRG